jgi:hypothetical protein
VLCTITTHTFNILISFFLIISINRNSKKKKKKAKRPPVEETASFLQALISSHGPDFLEKLFGAKARNALEPLGGVERVAIALSGYSKFILFFFKI